MRRLSFTRRIAMGAMLAAAATGIGFYIHIVTTRGAAAPRQPQCGHWCIQRCCELLGVSVDMEELLELLPPDSEGNTLLQLSETLEHIGLKCEGRKETAVTLPRVAMPCIAHLQHPDHFVVLASVDEKRVHLFDGLGRRTSWDLTTFADRWTGHLLLVRRDPNVVALPAYCRSEESSPRIQFDTLFVDNGTVEQRKTPLKFLFEFRNLGNGPLRITGVKPDCSCIEVVQPKGSIPRGGRSAIRLQYHPPPDGGPFFHKAIVLTNDPLFPRVVLKAAGWIDVPFSAHPGSIDFGRVPFGTVATRELILSSRTGEGTPQVITAKPEHPEVQVVVQKRNRRGSNERNVEAHRRRQTLRVKVRFAPSKASLGNVKTRLRIVMRGEHKRTLLVSVKASVVPPVRAYPASLSFGEVVDEESIRLSFTLDSLTGDRFRITDVGAADQSVERTYPHSAIRRGYVELRTSGSAALRLSETCVTVRARMVPSNVPVVLSIPVFTSRRSGPSVTQSTKSD